MTEKIIGVKELHKNMKKIVQSTAKGEDFIVVSRSKPVFRVVPYERKKEREQKQMIGKYILKDFEKLQFSSGEKDLSQRIDEIVYGLK